MEIKILGTGCPKCKKLSESTQVALQELGISLKIDKVTDINEIIDYGVMMTPALVIDSQIKSVGKIPTVEEIKKMIGDE